MDLRELRELLAQEKDPQIRREINKEIEKKEKEAQNHHSIMPDELQQDEQTIDEIDEKLRQARRELRQARAELRASISRFQEIYAAEQVRFEEGEWVQQPKGFDGFVEEYISKMEAENVSYQAIQQRIATLEGQIKRLQTERIERVRLEQSRTLQISLEDYTRITQTIENKRVYRKVLEKQGLGEILHKRGGRTKAEREAIETAKNEIVTRLAEVQRRSTEQIDIMETIDLLYGTDLTVKQTRPARKVSVTLEEAKRITEKVAEKPKRLVLEQPQNRTVIPGPAPSDIPRGGTFTTNDGMISIDVAYNPNQPTVTPVNGYTPADYKMTQEAWDDYIAQGFTPGTDDFNGAVILDGTGEIPQRRTTPNPSITPNKARVLELPPHVTPLALPPHVTPLALPPHVTPLALPPGKEPKTEPKTEVKTEPKPIPVPRTEPKTEPKTQPKTEPKTETKKQSTNLYKIIQKVTQGLDVKAKDGKGYKAANIKVAANFRNELRSGNYLYNIVHFVPAIIKLPFQFLTKVSGKLRHSKDAKKRMKIMKERLDNLSEEELMVIYREYRGNRVTSERWPSAINILIEERMQRFVTDKVTVLNAQLERDYSDIFAVYQQLETIRTQLADKSITPQQRQKLQEHRKQLLAGRGEQVRRIRETYIEAENWLSGGINGFGLDMKAATTKLSIVGMRFAKDHDLDAELLERQAKLKDAENTAIDTHNDEMALRVFVEAEMLMSRETEISNSIFGKRSTGKKYYSPLAERLDYRDDPFIKDLFTTLAVASSAFNIASSVRQQQIQAQNQAQIDAANQQLAEAQGLVDQIKGSQDKFREGMEAQAVQGTSTVTGQVERGALDSTNWGLGTSSYRTADNAGHDFYNQLYSDTQIAISDVSSKYASGAITQTQALEMMRDIANGTQSTLNQVSSQCLQIFTDYAKTHPQFDLTAVTEAVTYITQHPDAIAQMNNAVVDISNMASGLTFTQIQALQSLPSNMLTSLLSAASVAAITSNVTDTMTANVRKGKYGNSVTDMVAEYASEEERKKAEAEERESHQI